MGSYISYLTGSPKNDNQLAGLRQIIKQLEIRINLLERRMYATEHQTELAHDTLTNIETRTDSLEKTTDYINTSINYMQESIDGLIDETFETNKSL
jgi:hypothetical protein